MGGAGGGAVDVGEGLAEEEGTERAEEEEEVPTDITRRVTR